MNKVYACIDGLSNTLAVVDGAVWCARRLGVPLEFLHAIERHPERASAYDHSGTIGLDAQDALLRELSEVDARRTRLAQEAGRRLVAAAGERALREGIAEVEGRLRHGTLLGSVLDLEPDARLFVLGEHPGRPASSRLHLDHEVERVVRSVHRPVLVMTGGGRVDPQRAVIAFDGSHTARKAVETVARSPLLAGLPLLLAHAGGAPDGAARHALDEAHDALLAAGFEAEVAQVPGEPEEALLSLVTASGAGLLVMGAYGHTRVRHLIVGSTTTALLRLSPVPVLILR